MPQMLSPTPATPVRLLRPEPVEVRVAQVIRLRTGGTIRGLRVDVGGDRVTLTGRTTSFYNKQLATHAAMGALGDQPLSNDIIVN